MSTAPGLIPARLSRRICLACGYRGRELQAGGEACCSFHCPRCNSDLYARPPRSYAELEGFAPSDPLARVHAPAAPAVTLPRRKRWAHPRCRRFADILRTVCRKALGRFTGRRRRRKR